MFAQAPRLTEVPRALAPLRDHPQLPGPGDRFGAVGCAKLAQNVGDMLFDRVEGDHKFLGDAPVRRAGCEQSSTSISREVSGSAIPGTAAPAAARAGSAGGLHGRKPAGSWPGS